MKTYLFPKRAFNESNRLFPSLTKRQTLQIGLAEQNTTFFDVNDSVILDFGDEVSGGIRILTYYGVNVPVRIRFGESLTEACSELRGVQNATNDHSLRDLVIHLQNYSDMSFGQTGFRFVRLDFQAPVHIKCIVGVINC